MRDLVLGTTYADKVDCIMQSLEMARVTSMDVIDNAPARLGANPCGVDLFDLIAQMKQVEMDSIASVDPWPDWVSGQMIDALIAHAGVNNYYDVADMSYENLIEVPGIGPVTARRLLGE